METTVSAVGSTRPVSWKSIHPYGEEEEDDIFASNEEFYEEEDELQVDESVILRLSESDMIFTNNHDGYLHYDEWMIPHAEESNALELSSEQEERLPHGEARPILDHSSSRLSECPQAHVVVDESVEVSKTRTEFISVTLFRKANTSPSLGIYFRRSKRKLRVANIDKDGIFESTALQVGDEVVSINGISCKKLGSKSARFLIEKKWTKSSFINVVVRNEGGDAGLVTSTVMKPSPDILMGLGLKRINGSIRVSSIESSGLFVHSLLDVGHRCLFINDISCTNASLNQAAELVLSARDHVTIVTRPTSGLAMVVSAAPTRWWQIKISRLVTGLNRKIPF